MAVDNGNLYKCSEDEEIEAEAVNCPRRGRRMAWRHQRLQQCSCSNVSFYGARWQRMTKCKCNLR